MAQIVPFTLGGKDYTCAVVTAYAEAKKVVGLLEQTDYDFFGLDMETAPLPEFVGHAKGGLSPHLSQICTLQIFVPEESTVFLFQVSLIPNWVPLFKTFLECRKFFAHNAQFEIQHFLHKGITLGNIGCSQLLFSLLVHAVSDKPKSIKITLASLTSLSSGEWLEKTEQAGDWQNKTLTQQQIVYAAKDAVATVVGAEWCVAKIQERNLGDLVNFYRLNEQAQLAIAQMSLNGICINKEKHDELISEWKIEEAEAREELYKTIPPGLNIRSPKQLSDWIIAELSKTDTGLADLEEWPRSEKTPNLVCDSDTLKMFSDLSIVAPLLRFKK